MSVRRGHNAQDAAMSMRHKFGSPGESAMPDIGLPPSHIHLAKSDTTTTAIGLGAIQPLGITVHTVTM